MEYFSPNNLAQALETCHLTTQKNPLFGCTSGVFMDFNIPIVFNRDPPAKPRDLDPKKPYFPCTDVKDEFKQVCYYEIPQWWNTVYNKDYQKIGQLCRDIDNSLFKNTCYIGVGKIVPAATNFTPEDTIKYCSQMPDSESKLICLSNAYWIFSLNSKYKPLAARICSSLLEKEKQRCIENQWLFAKK